MDKILYLAPMEGITGYIYRNALQKYFTGIDFYMTPFISPTQNKLMNHRELEDILPDNNNGCSLIPQILSNNTDLFVETSKELSKYGYREVNLNLGCPSGTVVSKGKGAGFLSDLDKLDSFLNNIYNEVNGKMGMDISIKTRIGVSEPEEFQSLLIIFNQYPVKLLTVHPRVQKEFYKGDCHLDAFVEAVENSTNPLCYNGDLNTVEDFYKVSSKVPTVDSFMVGRGILKNPLYIWDLKKKSFKGEDCKKILKDFHDEIYFGYENIFSGDRNVLFKMKELWSYMGGIFNNADKILKKIRKAQRKDIYFAAVENMFELELNIK